MHTRQKKESGVTLIEVILALLIMGFLAAAVTMMPGGLGDMNNAFSLETAAKELESQLRYIQSLARTNGLTHGINIDNSHHYTLFQEDNIGNITIVDSPHDHQPMSYDISDRHPGVEFDFPTYSQELKFKGNSASPTAGGGLDIIVKQGADIKTISVTDITGRIEIIH